MSDYQTPEEARRELRRRMQTEGAQIAYETAVGICLDPKASVTAKASALNALLRVGGYDGKPDPDDDVSLDDMTPEQIRKRIVQIERELAARDADRANDLFA